MSRKYFFLILPFLVPLVLVASIISAQAGGDLPSFKSSVIHETTTVGEKGGMPAIYLIDNEGVFVTDYNNDYWPDLLITGPIQPVLYRNKNGNFKQDHSFPDIEEKITYAVRTDYNNDGWFDFVLIPRKGTPILLENNEGRFQVDRKLDGPTLQEGMGATVSDFNGNGCPDLFIIQYNNANDITPKTKAWRRLGKHFQDIKSDNGRRNFFLRGNCNTFKLVDDSIFHRNHWSLAVSSVDVNGDNLPDIHVTNDFGRDSLYINKRGGFFQHRYLPRSTHRNGMSSEIFDANRDGLPDIFVSNIYLPSSNSIWASKKFMSVYTQKPNGHNLLINQGNGKFKDQAQKFGVQRGGWGWSVSAGDFDNDFDLEIFQAKQNLLVPSISLNQFQLHNYDVAYFVGKYKGTAPIRKEVNIDTELRDQFHEWVGYPGIWDRKKNQYLRIKRKEKAFSRLNTRGAAALDFNRDGQLDLVMSQYDAPVLLFENTSTDTVKSKWIKIAVKPLKSRGTLTVYTSGGKRRLSVTANTDFHSQESPYYHLGLGKNETINKIKMEWNSGLTKTFNKVETNQLFVINGNKK